MTNYKSIPNPMRNNVLHILNFLLEDTNLTAHQRTMIENGIEEFDRFDKLYEVCYKSADKTST